MSNEFVAGDDYQPDPVFVNSLRETLTIILLFLLFMGWSICICFFMGNEQTYLAENPETLNLVWGMPSWVFYGIFLPWMLVNFLGIWFCFGYMKNDELGDDELDDNELGDNELGDNELGDNDRPQDPDKVNS